MSKIKNDDAPVFFDDNGRRWKIICSVVGVFLLSLAVALYMVMPTVVEPQKLTPMAVAATPGDALVKDSASGMSPTEVAAVVSRTNTPVIGTGALLRVVHIQEYNHTQYAVPLYTANGAVPLTAEETLSVGDHEFAIQRYGQSTVPKQIALTFDDGPDAKYTSPILDMLGREGVQGTFFVTGANTIKNPEILKRLAKEGHVIGNHTFNHVDFDFVSPFRAEQEIAQTNRAITAVTGMETSFFRLPYMGEDEQALRDHIAGILAAQHQGFLTVSHDFDSEDWDFTNGAKQVLPTFDGKSMIVLLHDSGGDRTSTIAYTGRLIKEAKAAGYTFTTINAMYTQPQPLYGPTATSLADEVSYNIAASYFVWPRAIVGKLFFLTVAALFFTLVVNVLLAIYSMHRNRFAKRSEDYEPKVSVVVSAYNEEKVLEATVRSVLQSDYKNLEIVIVDDGSKDDTFKVAKDLDDKYEQVRAFSKRNGGKSSGLNFGIKHANGEIIVGIDADTVFLPNTIDNLVRHFKDPDVAAVAGNVRVGNTQKIITRWQMLDYIIGIHIERNAQAALGAVMIVPGACGAWRKSAVIEAGGYRHITLAEDFDLTLSIHRLGYKVVQDNDAISFTEAPEKLEILSKQRFRWIYGTVQAFWKHRDMVFRRKYKWVGMVMMPWAIFNVIMPIIFIPILMVINLENILAGNIRTVILFFFATIGLQCVTALIALLLAKERLSLLLTVPFTRLVYSPLRTLLLYKTVIYALRGVSVGWNKFQRTGTVQLGGVQRTPVLEPAIVIVASSGSSDDKTS